MLDGTLQARAIRMLHAGDPVKLVARTTGLDLADVQQLQRDTPGLTRTNPTPVPAQPTAGDVQHCEHILELPTAVLREHPANVRTNLGDPVELDQLAQSIREQGVLQPIVVMRRDRQYVILAGHRRLAAAEKAGLRRVPIIIADTRDDLDSVQAMLVENLHPLATPAAALCTHDTLLKLGVACGPCWEYAIRTDERNSGSDA